MRSVEDWDMSKTKIHMKHKYETLGKRHEWKDIIVPLRLINHRDITRSG